jgi:hypothetical protein
VYVRAGGRVVKVCPTSITVAGTLAQWRAWTGLPPDHSGLIADGGGVVAAVREPVEHDHAVNVEPTFGCITTCAPTNLTPEWDRNP